MRCLDEALQVLAQAVRGRDALARHDERLDDLAAHRVGHADHRAFGDRLVLEQRVLDLGTGDVVAARDDHVVGARLVVEVAVLVDQIGVAGQVPAVPHIVALALVGEVAAAGRPAHREPAGLARRQRPHLVVDHHRLIARDRPAGGAGPDRIARGRDEDVQHLGGADAVDDREAGGTPPGLEGRKRQRLAGRDALAEARKIARPELVQHHPIGGRRGEADARAKLLDRLDQLDPAAPPRAARRMRQRASGR